MLEIVEMATYSTNDAQQNTYLPKYQMHEHDFGGISRKIQRGSLLHNWGFKKTEYSVIFQSLGVKICHVAKVTNQSSEKPWRRNAAQEISMLL
jgi:hypothetical protein